MNEYEEAVYACLVRYGPLSASEIHRKANVPQNRIYDIVVSLEKKGFIEIQPSEPKLFKAIEPKIAFLKIKEELERKEAALEESFKKQRHPEKEKQIWMTQGPEAFVQARLTELKTAKKEICTMVGKEREVTTDDLAMISREHKNALERGVNIKIMWNMEQKENIEKAKRLVPFGSKVRHYPVSGFTMAVIDSEKVRVDFPDKMFEHINLWIENKDFARAMKNYFENCWKEGKDWKKFNRSKP